MNAKIGAQMGGDVYHCSAAAAKHKGQNKRIPCNPKGNKPSNTNHISRFFRQITP